MQTNIIWKGIEYNSSENCLVTTSSEGSEIHATITGSYQTFIYLVEYFIRTNKNWETVYLEVRMQHSDRKEYFFVESDGNGKWYKGGKHLPEFDGCVDVDISLTPFTNTLPISRLGLKVNESKLIKVFFVDVLEFQHRVATQRYTRKREDCYNFQNVPNDFEADISVNDHGFVQHYPGLFECVALLDSNYE